MELAPRQKRVQVARDDDDISLQPHPDIDEKRDDDEVRNCPPLPNCKNEQRNDEAQGEHDPEHQREASDKSLKDDAKFRWLVKVNGEQVLNEHGVEPEAGEGKQKGCYSVKVPISDPPFKPKVFANGSHNDNDGSDTAENRSQNEKGWQDGRMPTRLESNGEDEGNIGVDGNHDDEQENAHDGHDRF